MAVPQLVHIFEALERPSTPPQNRLRSPSKIRLQLQTMFSQSRTKAPSASSTPSSSARSSPSPSHRSYSRHVQTPASDLTSLFGPLSAASSPSSTTRRHVRRQPSAIDVVLEQERCAEGPENIGLGLLEPRPRAPTPVSAAAGQCSLLEFMTESQPVPAVLDGIFEVMESH
jgi:hypothetical protein